MGLNENDKDDLIRYWYLDWDGVLTEEDFYPIPDDRFHSCQFPLSMSELR
mgnify:CR=1 FL=1